MTTDSERQFLKDEYLHLQDVIEGFDGRSLTIKAWSVSFSLAALAGAFASNSDIVLLVSAGSSLLFWLIEGQWKGFQYAYYARAKDIEKYFRGESEPIAPMQINASWYANWKAGGWQRLVRILFWPHVSLPHMPIMAVASGLYLLALSGVIKV